MTKLLWINTGDSISGPAGRWPWQYLGITSRGDATNINGVQTVYATGNVVFVNVAMSGTRFDVSAGSGSTQPVIDNFITPLIATNQQVRRNRLTRRRIMVTCAIGSNDGAVGGFGSGNSAQYAGAVAAYLQKCRVAGADLVGMCTLLPRNDGVMTEPNRTTFNSTITGGSWKASNKIDFVFDLAGETTIGNPANNSNATYYSDGIHPTDTGSALLATNQVAPVMTTILAQL